MNILYKRRWQTGTVAQMLIDGWLGPDGACAALGISRLELDRRVRRGEVRRCSLSPGVYLFEVTP